MKFFITHSQYYDIRKMNQKTKKLLQFQSLYLLVRYDNDVQDAINILWTAYSCLGISTAISLPDLIIILLFQVISFKESFFYWSTNQLSVTHQLSGPTICFWHWKPDLCCYCAAEGIQQQQDNDLKKKYWVVLPLCQACLRDKKLILKRNPIKNWQNMNLMLHNCF